MVSFFLIFLCAIFTDVHIDYNANPQFMITKRQQDILYAISMPMLGGESITS